MKFVNRPIPVHLHFMKSRRLPTLLALICIANASAQTDLPANPSVTPAHPKGFSSRSIGGGVNSGASVTPGPDTPPTVRYTAYIVLHENRTWSNTGGKAIEAKLIAFEDLVAEAPQGAAQPAMPEPPEKPTLIRHGKIRLLVNGKPSVVALEKLGTDDREFIAGMQAALAKQAEK
jgi:hypothetical protein